MEYRRQVAMRCDGEDFVIALQPEDDLSSAPRMRALSGIFAAGSTDDWTWPPEGGGGARLPAKRS
jgi:hypothetical protein